MPIKSFRGLMDDGAIDTITLHTNDGSIGYRIVKFQIMTEKVSTVSVEHTVQIFKVPQTTASATVDFSNQTLLGVAITMSRSDAYNAPIIQDIIFDSEVFNQDIYITHIDNLASESCNYYIELEQVRLDLGDNTVATLKDIRNIKS